MKIQPFLVEEWMNAHETTATYNIAETCVDSILLQELFQLAGVDGKAYLEKLADCRLSYGEIEGSFAFKQGVCSLYTTLKPENVVSAHGAAAANLLLFYSLVEPGDRVISVKPSYQQLYSIPESFGADLQILPLRKENGYLPDLEELRRLAIPGTRLICINNPNNPTGVLMSDAFLRQVAEIARAAGAYVLCDEVYRGLNQEDCESASIVDLYEKGISVGSLSKTFSLAGLRLGWFAVRDEAALKAFLSHRDYNLISCGMLDEMIGALALENQEVLMGRSKKIVRENLAILDDWVRRQPHISYLKPRAGTTALLCYDMDVNSYDFCRQMLEQTGAFLTPGDCFGQPNSMRIGYACEKEVLTAGLDAVGRYLSGWQ